MKLLINASNIYATGATQVTISFLHEIISIPSNKYYILLSKKIAGEIENIQFPENFYFFEVPYHPMSSGFIRSAKTRKLLKKFEVEINPDVVFTIFGPSYWKPKVPHLQGFAYAHYIYRDSPYWETINKWQLLKVILLRFIHLRYFKNTGKYYVCETQDVSDRVVSLLKISPKNVYTVNNNYSSAFYNFTTNISLNLLKKKEHNEYRLLSPCSFMTHKNLKIINKVVGVIKQRLPDWNVIFVLTIDSDAFDINFTKEAKESIINIGRIPVNLCPQIYSECDALFLPTLLECFSASYPEAMFMEKPILTSNLSFARSICKDAALYFDPLDVDDIVNKIIILITNESKKNELIKKGQIQLTNFDNASLRASKYLNICKQISRL